MLVLPEVSSTDYVETINPPVLPQNIDRLLNAAKRVVGDHLQWCTYMPSDLAHVEAVKTAVCEQAQVWAEANIDPVVEGLRPSLETVQSASLLGGSFTNAGSGVIGRNRAAAANNIAYWPRMTLEQAGIRLAPIEVIG